MTNPRPKGRFRLLLALPTSGEPVRFDNLYGPARALTGRRFEKRKKELEKREAEMQAKREKEKHYAG